MSEVEKVIRYKVVVTPPDLDAAMKTQRQINERLRQDARGTQAAPAQPAGAPATVQAEAQGSAQGAPPSPPPALAARQPNWQWWRPPRSRPTPQQVATRQPVQPSTGSAFSDFFHRLQLALRSNIGLGPNTVFGQYLRGVGFGGTGTAANFARYTAGNINFGNLARLIPIAQQGSPALAGAARGAIGQMVGGAALRGAGGALLGAPGAALAGAGPIGLAVGAVLLSVKNIATALKEASQAVTHFAAALYSGDASQALKGLVSYGQSIVRIIGGPIIGALMSKVVGVGNVFIDAMDGLVAKLGRWSPIVLAQQARYQIAQMMYERQLSLALAPLMNAWMQIKLKVLDGLVRVADAIIAAARVTWKFVEAGIAFIRFLLKVSGLATLFDLLRSGISYLVDSFKQSALMMLFVAKGVFDFVAKWIDPSGAAKKMSEAIDVLVGAITRKSLPLSQALQSLTDSFFGVKKFGLQTHAGPGDMQPRQDARRRGVVSTDETPGLRLPGGEIQAVPPMLQSSGPGKQIITPPPTTQPAAQAMAQPVTPLMQPGLPAGQRRIPALAKGGVVRRPTFALIGEAGPEAVIPLSKATSPHNFSLQWHRPHPDSELGHAAAFSLPPTLPTPIEHKAGMSIRDKAMSQAMASPYFSPYQAGLKSESGNDPLPTPPKIPGISMRLPGGNWVKMDPQPKSRAKPTLPLARPGETPEQYWSKHWNLLEGKSTPRLISQSSRSMRIVQAGSVEQSPGLPRPSGNPIRNAFDMQMWMMRQEKAWIRQKLGLDSPPPPSPPPPAPIPPLPQPSGKQIAPITRVNAIPGGSLPAISPPLPLPSAPQSVPALPSLPSRVPMLPDPSSRHSEHVDPNEIDPNRVRRLPNPSPLPKPAPQSEPWWSKLNHDREKEQQNDKQPMPTPASALPAVRAPAEPMPASPAMPTTRSTKTEKEADQKNKPSKADVQRKPTVSVTEDRSGTKPQLGLPFGFESNRHDRIQHEIDRLRDLDKEDCADDESTMLVSMFRGHMLARGM